MKMIHSKLLAVIAASLLAIPAMAQKITVSGQVIDGADGQPLVGVGVIPSGGGGEPSQTTMESM